MWKPYARVPRGPNPQNVAEENFATFLNGEIFPQKSLKGDTSHSLSTICKLNTGGEHGGCGCGVMGSSAPLKPHSDNADWRATGAQSSMTSPDRHTISHNRCHFDPWHSALHQTP